MCCVIGGVCLQQNPLAAAVTMDLGFVQYIIFVTQVMAACVVSISLNNGIKDHGHDNDSDDEMEDNIDTKTSANAPVVHPTNGAEADVGAGSINENGAYSNTEHRHVMMVQLQNTTDEERDADYRRISIQSVVLWFALLLVDVGLCASQLLVDVGTSRMNIYSVVILLLVTRFSPLLFVEKMIYVALQCIAFFAVQIYYGLSVSLVRGGLCFFCFFAARAHRENFVEKCSHNVVGNFGGAASC